MLNTREMASALRLTTHWAQVMRERSESGLSIKVFCKMRDTKAVEILAPQGFLAACPQKNHPTGLYQIPWDEVANKMAFETIWRKSRRGKKGGRREGNTLQEQMPAQALAEQGFGRDSLFIRRGGRISGAAADLIFLHHPGDPQRHENFRRDQAKVHHERQNPAALSHPPCDPPRGRADQEDRRVDHAVDPGPLRARDARRHQRFEQRPEHRQREGLAYGGEEHHPQCIKRHERQQHRQPEPLRPDPRQERPADARKADAWRDQEEDQQRDHRLDRGKHGQHGVAHPVFRRDEQRPEASLDRVEARHEHRQDHAQEHALAPERQIGRAHV